MKKTIKRVLASMLVLAMVIAALVIPNANTNAATAGDKLYVKPNTNWTKDGARFAAYFFGNGEKWVNCTASDAGTGIYEVTIPSGGYTSVIFCRMDPSKSTNNWDSKWNQTSDLTIPSGDKTLYTVAANTWDKGGGSWSAIGGTTVVSDYYVTGDFNNWNVKDANYKMTKSGSNFVYTKTLPAGKYSFQVTDGTADNKYPADSYAFEVLKECTVTFTFTESTYSPSSSTSV